MILNLKNIQSITNFLQKIQRWINCTSTVWNNQYEWTIQRLISSNYNDSSAKPSIKKIPN